MLEKMPLLQSKTLHQASIKACTSLSRLIVFPSSAGLPGIWNHLSQESNYCERGVLLWIAQLPSLVEGCLDCQHRLLLNCQNSHQARVEASSCGRYIRLFQMLWHPHTQAHRGPGVTWNPYFFLSGHFTWNMCWRSTQGIHFRTLHQPAMLYCRSFSGGRSVASKKRLK